MGYTLRYNNLTIKSSFNIYKWFVNVFQLTWADISISIIMEMMSSQDESVLIKWPPLGDLMKRVHNEPKIKAWIEKRPKTSMWLNQMIHKLKCKCNFSFHCLIWEINNDIIPIFNIFSYENKCNVICNPKLICSSCEETK